MRKINTPYGKDDSIGCGIFIFIMIIIPVINFIIKNLLLISIIIVSIIIILYYIKIIKKNQYKEEK